VNRINLIFASHIKNLPIRFGRFYTGEKFVAGAIFHRLLGLLALLGLSLLFGAPAYASDGLSGAKALDILNGAKPWYIATQENAEEKPACVHATEHSHESCRACGKPYVWRFVSRHRTKAAVSNSTAINIFLLKIRTPPALENCNAHSSQINEILSQTSFSGTDIFARTNRLRI
jgi:hypothetical protein